MHLLKKKNLVEVRVHPELGKLSELSGNPFKNLDYKSPTEGN